MLFYGHTQVQQNTRTLSLMYDGKALTHVFVFHLRIENSIAYFGCRSECMQIITMSISVCSELI